VVFTCLKRNLTKEIKVAQLAGSVAEHSAYHHGEVSFGHCMLSGCFFSDRILWVANFRPYVRPSTKSFFDFDEIWFTGSTR